jgi:hypothetical protein
MRKHHLLKCPSTSSAPSTNRMIPVYDSVIVYGRRKPRALKKCWYAEITRESSNDIYIVL